MAIAIPKEYIERSKLLNYNHEEYVAWCEYLLTKHPNTGTPKTYSNDVINFLEIYNKSIENISSQDINTYISKIGISTQRKQVYAIANFLKYVQRNYYKQLDNKSIIDGISYSNEDQIKKAAEPLKIDEIINLRNQLNKAEDFCRLFIFELVYTYGLSLDELVECSKSNFSFDTSSLTLKTKTITINDFLTKLCFENPKLLIQHDRGYYQYHINRLEKYIGHSVRYMDIEATRREHLIKCPSCGNKVINTSEEWVLVEREDEVFHQKWLICKSCAYGGAYNE